MITVLSQTKISEKSGTTIHFCELMSGFIKDNWFLMSVSAVSVVTCFAWSIGRNLASHKCVTVKGEVF